MIELYPLLLLIFASTGISIAVALYALDYIRQYGATRQVVAFTWFAVAVGTWTLFEMIQLAATDFQLAFLSYQFAQIGALNTGPPLLLYALTTGPAKRWVTRTVGGILVLAALPLFVLVFVAPVDVLFVDPHLVPFGNFSVISHGNRPIYTVYLFWNQLLLLAGVFYREVGRVPRGLTPRMNAVKL